MIQMETMLVVADNTGARSAKMIGVLGKRSRTACIGDVITCHIRDSIPTAAVKKGSVVKAVVRSFALTPTRSSSSTRTTTRAAPGSSDPSPVNSASARS